MTLGEEAVAKYEIQGEDSPGFRPYLGKNFSDAGGIVPCASCGNLSRTF